MKEQKFEMNATEYQSMYKVEIEHWWYKGLRDYLLYWTQRIFANVPANGVNILDAGCGTGINLIEHEKVGFNVWGIDSSEDAVQFTIKRGAKNVSQAFVQKLPFDDQFFDLIYNMDVIVMLSEDDVKKTFLEFRRCLKNGGVIMINSATLAFLYSSHDVASNVVARHSKATLERILNDVGFVLEKSTYRLFFLFPLLAFIKIVQKIGLKAKRAEIVKGDLEKTNAFLNTILFPIMKFENFLLKSINLPIGTSLFIVARKE